MLPFYIRYNWSPAIFGFAPVSVFCNRHSINDKKINDILLNVNDNDEFDVINNGKYKKFLNVIKYNIYYINII